MSLEDLLGITPEIKIFDFLAENMDSSYTPEEISGFTGLPRATVNTKIMEMIKNNLIENGIHQIKTYRLADNGVVMKLMSLALEHSFSHKR